ncbi:hypothetical protein L9F63_003902, partial [Diploptera punctata]
IPLICVEVFLQHPTSCDEGFVKKEKPDEILAFADDIDTIGLLINGSNNKSENFDKKYRLMAYVNRIEDSTLKALLLSSGEFYKNYDLIRKAMTGSSETPEQRREWLDKMCLYLSQKRANESTEEREERLAKLRMREAQRRTDETPDRGHID